MRVRTIHTRESRQQQALEFLRIGKCRVGGGEYDRTDSTGLYRSLTRVSLEERDGCVTVPADSTAGADKPSVGAFHANELRALHQNLQPGSSQERFSSYIHGAVNDRSTRDPFVR